MVGFLRASHKSVFFDDAPALSQRTDNKEITVMTTRLTAKHRFKSCSMNFVQGTLSSVVVALLSGIRGIRGIRVLLNHTSRRASPLFVPLLTVLIASAFLLTTPPLSAQGTTSSQILIDETLVVYDIPKGYTNAPQAVVNAIKDEFAVQAPISWVDFVAAYSPSPESTLNKLSKLASERLVIFLEMGLISQKFSPKDFLELNSSAIQYARSKDTPTQEYRVDNCQIVISRPHIFRSTDKQFTVGFLETFICPKETNWTQTIVSRLRVHQKIITVHQLCTSSDYKDILRFKKDHATALANLHFR